MTDIIVIPQKEPEPPKCPHCGKDLPGWTEPDPPSLVVLAIVVFTVVFLCVQALAFGVGCMDGSHHWERCEWPETRADILVPGWAIGCGVGKWASQPWSQQ